MRALLAGVAGVWAAFPHGFGKWRGGGHAAAKGPRKLRWGMVIDLDRCTACQACVVACAVENNQMRGSPEVASRKRFNRWFRIVPLMEDAAAEHPRRGLVPLPCLQCENPPCTKVCPTSATYINPEGIVGQVYPRCFGCRYCVNACPYTVKFFNWRDPQWPGRLAESHNPDVSPRYRGVVEKCLFCHHRLQRARDAASAEGRDFKPGEYQPACAVACPAEAITFGDLDDPRSEVARLARSPRAFKMLEDLGTEPKVLYLREG